MDRDLTKVVCMLIICNKKAAVRGVFSHPQVKRFGCDTPEKGTKLKISKLTDFDKQVVYIGVVDPAESKSGLMLGKLLHCLFDHFCQELEKNSKKLVGQIGSQIRHWLLFAYCMTYLHH